MRLLCHLGLHRWSYNTEIVAEPELHTHTEIILARCARPGCVRYGEWTLVHREAHEAKAVAPESPPSLA